MKTWTVALLCSVAVVGAAAQAAGATPPPAQAFVDGDQISHLRLSPSGQNLAFSAIAPNGRRVLMVRPLSGGATKVLAAYSDASVSWLRWVNDQRIVYYVRQSGAVIDRGGDGIYAINADGSNERELIASRPDNMVTGSRIEARVLPWGWGVAGTLDDGSDDVLVARTWGQDVNDPQAGRLARLNTRNGSLTPLSADAPAFGQRWLLDAKLQLRVTTTERDGRVRIHWLPPGSREWQVVLDQGSFAPTRMEALALEGDSNLLVEGRLEGQDFSGLYVLDLKTGRVDPSAVLALRGYDLDAELEVDTQTRRVVGVHTQADRPVSVWFDARLAAVQKAVDAALPAGRVNRLICGRCLSTQHFVVHSQGDNQPGVYLHYDHQKRTLAAIGNQRPWLTEASQGRRTWHRVPARDGLPLPVVVTHPPGAATAPKPDAAASPAATTPVATPLPTVVLVHGGPWVRGGDVLWSGEAQFLATRGYRVLEVEFRGSTGFGFKHHQAGWKQWGEAMQDDLADAVAWAAEQGYTDKARVCIAGSSYGGYAALMAPIRHPGVFRCAASHNGVTDPQLMFSAAWSDLSDQSRRVLLPTQLGDPVADRELLRRHSPLHRVTELKIPVLMAWGGNDRRVPPEHAERFLAAARAAGLVVDSKLYPHEGHGWFDFGNHADHLQRLEAFVARELRR
jgi:dipeptidyl aminopeptidase/acylaminoacyl peptidase